ncbi:helix-turn-helix transcriptional regulator [Polymorphospora sp. NPDC050346]|uniref:helix-turn-helix domain-containing protein n=1 Tax=Polymorphospora sp. NPDC050346 TaxID=3155780 RepID=UPI0033EE6EC6
MPTSPLIRRRSLARELRRLRDTAELTSAELAARARMSRPKLSRFETAERVPSVPDLSAILAALDVTGDHWHNLIQTAKDAAERGWWESYGAAMGDRQAVYADLEHGARTVREYQLFVVPGLLQTPAYTRARAELARKQARLPDVDLDRIVEAKMMRQRMLTRPDGPQYEAVIEEVVALRPAAPPTVMREQLLHLADLAEQAGPTTVRVLPTRAQLPHHWLPRSPFSLYEYRDDPPAAAVDTETTDLVYTESREVAPYAELYQHVRNAALSPADSAALLRDAATTADRGGHP